MNAPARARPPLWIGTRGVVALAAAACVAGALARFVPWSIAVALVAQPAGAAFVADALAGARAFSFRRIAPERFALARPDAFRYEVENRGNVRLRFAIVEAPVARLAIAFDERPAAIAPRARDAVAIPFVPRERGRTALVASYAWVETSFGLVRHRLRRDDPQPIRVLPDLGGLDASSDLAPRARSIEAGLRRLRRRGDGTEFESLREYAPGDAFRAIDWKASARRGRTMVAQREVERGQHIVVAIDAGRLMSARLGDRRKLDYAVSAALALSALARRAGDRIGVHAFAARTLVALPPGTGAAHATAIVEALADLEPQFEESDYERATLEIRRAHRKRSLVVAFTDLFDPVASRAVLAALVPLVRHHLVLVVLMNDAAIARALDHEPRDLDDAYRAGVAATLAAERGRAVAALRAQGAIVVDVPAPELSLALLDAYVEVKTRARL
jgi:uncharacterized protein (DUF58 family)